MTTGRLTGLLRREIMHTDVPSRRKTVPQTWLELAHLVLTLAGIVVLGLLARVLFELWLTLRQIRADWMPRIRDLLATTDETMASVEGVTRVAREQVEGWNPLVTDARHAAEGVRDQASLAMDHLERSARHVDESVIRPLSREWAIWRHGLAVLGKHLAQPERKARGGEAERSIETPGARPTPDRPDPVES